MSDTIDTLPRITVAEIWDMGDEAFEALLDRIEAENRAYRIVDEIGGRDVVILPYALYRTMTASTSVTIEDHADDGFAEAFRNVRGTIDPDLDVGC